MEVDFFLLVALLASGAGGRPGADGPVFGGDIQEAALQRHVAKTSWRRPQALMRSEVAVDVDGILASRDVTNGFLLSEDDVDGVDAVAGGKGARGMRIVYSATTKPPAKLGGSEWLLGGGGLSCKAACGSLSMACSTDTFYDNVDTIAGATAKDSLTRMTKVLKDWKLRCAKEKKTITVEGKTTPIGQWPKAVLGARPWIETSKNNETSCAVAPMEREDGAFDCKAEPASVDRRRLCFCEVDPNGTKASDSGGNNASSSNDVSDDEDPGPPPPPVEELEYGMQIVIAFSWPKQIYVGTSPFKRRCNKEGCYVAFMDPIKRLRFSSEWKNEMSFYVRPPPTSTQQGCVEFNKQIVLARSSDPDKTKPCGWYGCKVVTLDGQNKGVLKKGGDDPTKFWVRAPPTADGLAEGCIRFNDAIVLAVDDEEGKQERCGWYGCRVAGMTGQTSRMTFSPGRNRPSALFVRKPAALKTKSVLAVCEAAGTLATNETRMSGVGGAMFNMHQDKDACKDDCVKRGALYFSYRMKAGESACHCGVKSKTLSWAFSKASPTKNPWFLDPKPCSESQDTWCTEGTSCRRCMLIAFDPEMPKKERTSRIGDCVSTSGSLGCESRTDGEWVSVSPKECFMACSLEAYDGMKLEMQKDFSIGKCRPLKSMEKTPCEKWQEGRWSTVSKAECNQGSGWKMIGHFENPSIVEVKAQGSFGISTKWRISGGAEVHRSTEGQSYHPLAWIEFQQNCSIEYPSKHSPGEATITVPTVKGAPYTVIFQAATSKDHDGNGMSLGTVMVDGTLTSYQLTGGDYGMDEVVWHTLEIGFVGGNTASNIAFSEIGEQCIRIREVFMRSGVPFVNSKSHNWQNPFVLKRAFNRVGCPTRDSPESDLLSKQIMRWRESEAKAVADMWMQCEQARAGSTAHQQICCGKGKTCTPTNCNVRVAVEDSAGQWVQWMRMSGYPSTQSGVQDVKGPVSPEDDARLALDNRKSLIDAAGMSCTNTNSSEAPWWQVDLETKYDVSAVRVTFCKDCLWQIWGDDESIFQVLVDGAVCITGVTMKSGQMVEMPCVATGRNVKVQRLGDGELALCEVEVQVTGRAISPKGGKCPYELSVDHFKGTGNALEGYVKKGEYLESYVKFQRPVRVTAELKADKPEALSVSLFAPQGDHRMDSGYALQTGFMKTKAMASPGLDNMATVGPNDNWHIVEIEASNGGDVIFSVNNEPLFSLSNRELVNGSLQFIAGNGGGGHVRNVGVSSNKVCAVDHRGCTMGLPLLLDEKYWTGDGNVRSGKLAKGEYIQSVAKFPRPFKVNAEMRAHHPGAIALQIFGDDAERGTADTGISLMTGVRMYEVRSQPSGFQRSFGQNHVWTDVEIGIFADHRISYYLNGVLIDEIYDSNRTIGAIRFVAVGVAMEVRNVRIELEGSCQTKRDGQPHELWTAND
eukprot:TRINITY_DN48902_c0_g1_i1.p1 TRINITY_DN48902_c0_g1~~TRINITY_DN48902_c0_g1_i1.p1  ORF type:complete len:1428 (-),score=254.43 TRINITY_DN48902_c0_g1_i1:69-4352(-)